jgi:predicted dehydrogenase
MDRTLPRFAIVGCGLIGRKRLGSLGAGQLSVACDLEISRAEELVATAGHGRATADLDDALHDSAVDAVVVSALNSSLASIARKAIVAGKHTLIEKPAGVSVAQIDELIELSHEHGVQVRVGYNHRFHPGLLKARELIDAGAIGPLMFLRGRYGHGGRLGYDREWRADPKLSGGGELIDQGVHLIDLAH